MKPNNVLAMACLLAVTSISVPAVQAAPKKGQKAAQETPLSASGSMLEKKYAETLKELRAEIEKSLPRVDESKKTALMKAHEAVAAAIASAGDAQKPQDEIKSAKALVEHAKGKWIGGAEKGITAAQAALKKATTDAERQAAQADLAKWQANKEEGVKALKERQAAFDKAVLAESKSGMAGQTAQAALAKAQTDEKAMAKALLAMIDPAVSSDKMDAKLVKCTVLSEATPHGLAEFAQQGKEQEAMVEKLLANDTLMKDMLVAGGADYGKYGQAMEIYSAIQKASSKAGEGKLQHLALATALEFSTPIAQSNPKDKTDAPATVDPVKRYLHYEKAFLAGELDPAFKNLNTWEYRMAVNCDAPDEILSWGREMLRNYRPDHIYNPDYGWRYSAAVKTEVPYGSQNVSCDLDTLHNYQNIIKDGGVCGRRAFFGRFMLRCFGIPTWGVTQHAHAALSHWTPKGWVINLGAGFEHSWWDKNEMSLSGTQFLLESQARARGADFLKVLRAEWINRILGEPIYNERKNVAGGFWSSMANYQSIALASSAVTLGPLGQELAEANEAEKVQSASVSADEQRVTEKDGAIIVPAVAHSKASGKGIAMKSYSGGMQLHCLGGFNADYAFDAPSAGKYTLTARIVTVQEGQQFLITASDAKSPVEVAVPYTTGMWQQTQPVEVSMVNGKNVIHIALKDGSRGVTVKEFTLTPVR